MPSTFHRSCITTFLSLSFYLYFQPFLTPSASQLLHTLCCIQTPHYSDQCIFPNKQKEWHPKPRCLIFPRCHYELIRGKPRTHWHQGLYTKDTMPTDPRSVSQQPGCQLVGWHMEIAYGQLWGKSQWVGNGMMSYCASWI